MPGAIIAALIVERPMCLDCLAMKTNVSVTRVDEALTTISRDLVLRRDIRGRCRVCGNLGVVVSFDRQPAR